MRRKYRKNIGVPAAMVASEAVRRTPTWVFPAAIAAAAGGIYILFRSPAMIIEGAGKGARAIIDEGEKTILHVARKEIEYVNLVATKIVEWLNLMRSHIGAARRKEAAETAQVIKTWQYAPAGVQDTYQKVLARSPQYITLTEALFLVKYVARAEEAKQKGYDPAMIGTAKSLIDQVSNEKLKSIGDKDLALQRILERDNNKKPPTKEERKWIYDEIERTHSAWRDGKYKKPGYRAGLLSMEAAAIGNAFLKQLRERLAEEEREKKRLAEEGPRRVLKPFSKK